MRPGTTVYFERSITRIAAGAESAMRTMRSFATTMYALVETLPERTSINRPARTAKFGTGVSCWAWRVPARQQNIIVSNASCRNPNIISFSSYKEQEDYGERARNDKKKPAGGFCILRNRPMLFSVIDELTEG